jgi:hypothetical protein
LNWATRSWNRAGSRPRTTSRAGSRRPPPTGHDRQSTAATASSKASAQTFAPNPPLPRAARNRPAPPANDVAAVRAPCRPWAVIGRRASPPPCSCRGPPCGDARDPLTKAHCLFKPSRLSSREHPSPAAVAIVAVGEHLAPLAPVASSVR